MSDLLSEGLVLPALLLGILGFVVPRLLARFLPEGVTPLLVNGFLSTVLTFMLSSAFFYLLYLWQGAPSDKLSLPDLGAAIVFFGRLGLASALIWAPIMLLSLAGLPRKWVHETW